MGSAGGKGRGTQRMAFPIRGGWEPAIGHLVFLFNLALLYKFMSNIPGMGLQASDAWLFQRPKQEARKSEMA